jgi:hypothetical protein
MGVAHGEAPGGTLRLFRIRNLRGDLRVRLRLE